MRYICARPLTVTFLGLHEMCHCNQIASHCVTLLIEHRHIRRDRQTSESVGHLATLPACSLALLYRGAAAASAADVNRLLRPAAFAAAAVVVQLRCITDFPAAVQEISVL